MSSWAYLLQESSFKIKSHIDIVPEGFGGGVGCRYICVGQFGTDNLLEVGILIEHFN